MFVIIAYGVNTQNSAGKKRLRNVAKVCVSYGQRVQNSVFGCVMDQTKCKEVKHKLTGLIGKGHDSLRFYYLGNDYKNKVERIGVKPNFNIGEGVLFI